MRRLVYTFEDGKVVKTYDEAKEYKSVSGLIWKEEFVEVPIDPSRDISCGIDFYKGSFLKESFATKRTDAGNIAKRGHFISTGKDILANTLAENPWLTKTTDLHR